MYLNTLINPWLYVILRRESVRRFFVLVLRCRQRCCVNAEEEQRNTEVTNFANPELNSDWRIHSEILADQKYNFYYFLFTYPWPNIHKVIWGFFRMSSQLNQVPCIRWSGSINIHPFLKIIKALCINVNFAVPKL